uniref:Uncharacterized protein n=1 Tax=Tanacetum cinerariifolium TaxID=118510 RepID=A0A699GN63_TANCI|nr:hypothetical protein [Tanacetum cinerariifolium]
MQPGPGAGQAGAGRASPGRPPAVAVAGLAAARVSVHCAAGVGRAYPADALGQAAGTRLSGRPRHFPPGRVRRPDRVQAAASDAAYQGFQFQLFRPENGGADGGEKPRREGRGQYLRPGQGEYRARVCRCDRGSADGQVRVGVEAHGPQAARDCRRRGRQRAAAGVAQCGCRQQEVQGVLPGTRVLHRQWRHDRFCGRHAVDDQPGRRPARLWLQRAAALAAGRHQGRLTRQADANAIDASRARPTSGIRRHVQAGEVAAWRHGKAVIGQGAGGRIERRRTAEAQPGVDQAVMGAERPQLLQAVLLRFELDDAGRQRHRRALLHQPRRTRQRGQPVRRDAGNAAPHAVGARCLVAFHAHVRPAQRLRRKRRHHHVQHARAGIDLVQRGRNLPASRVRRHALDCNKPRPHQQARRHAGHAAPARARLHRAAKHAHLEQDGQRHPAQITFDGKPDQGRQQARQCDPARGAPAHDQCHRHADRHPEQRFDDEHHVAVDPAAVERVPRVHAVRIGVIHAQVQREPGHDAQRQPPSRRAAGPQQLPRGRPQPPQQRRQQQRLRYRQQGRVGVAAMVEQVAQRGRQQLGQHQVQVREITGQHARDQQQAVAYALLVFLCFRGQTAMDELSGAKADNAVGDVIHESVGLAALHQPIAGRLRAAKSVGVAHRALALYVHAAPECDMVADVAGRLERLGVVPGGVVAGLAVGTHVVVAGDAFPRAARRVRAGLQVVGLDRVAREVHIVFDDFHFVVISLGNDDAVQGSGWHGGFLSEVLGGGTFNAVAAAPLGAEQRGVGLAQQAFGVGNFEMVEGAHAQAGRDTEHARADFVRLCGNAQSQRLGKPQGAGQRRARQHHAQFLAAVAAGDIDHAHVFAQQQADGGQHLVAGRMAEFIVDALEVVEIDHDGRQRCPEAPRARRFEPQPVQQRTAVVQARELVGGGQQFQLAHGGRQGFFAGAQFDQRHHLARQLGQHGALVVAQAPGPGIHHAQRAYGKPVGRHQRHAAVHAHERRIDGERHVRGAGIEREIGDFEVGGAHDRQRAIALPARQLAQLHARARLDPHAVGIDQVDGGIGHVAQARGQLGDGRWWSTEKRYLRPA